MCDMQQKDHISYQHMMWQSVYQSKLALSENMEDLELVAYSTSQTWSLFPESLSFVSSECFLSLLNSFECSAYWMH
jgi:hypothetical protein